MWHAFHFSVTLSICSYWIGFCICVSVSVSVGVIAFMIRLILTSHRTSHIHFASLGNYQVFQLNYTLFSSECYVLYVSACLAPIHLFVLIAMAKDMEKSRCFKWKKKKKHVTKKNETTQEQQQKPNKKKSKIKSNQSQRFALKTLDKQINENDEERRKKIVQTFDASENRMNIPTESRLFTQK